MPPAGPYRTLLQRSIVVLVLCALAVLACYYWIDCPVAFFVHRDGIDQHRLFRWLTDPPPLVQAWSPLLLAILLVRRAWGPLPRWQSTLLTACVSLILADVFRASLGEVFGRYWPETWFHNPSLIGTGTYGFHFFAGGEGGSFPSGHAARIVGFGSVWWLAYPRSRALVALIALPMMGSLVAMNYHFVSDVIAGSVLGGIVGAYMVQLAGLTTDSAGALLERDMPASSP